jgi:hypothetical protein
MTLSKVETFEHDIAGEILKKEEKVTRLDPKDELVAEVTAQTAVPVKTSSPLTITAMVVVLILVAVSVAGYFGYTYYTKQKEQQALAASQVRTPPEKNTAKFFEITFPELSGLSRFVTKAERNPYGFSITINEYTPVFSFIIKNEGLFAESMAKALNVTEGRDGPYIFSGQTIANYNMRVGVSGSSSVAYTFVGNNLLVISTSTDGLSAASGIIK